VMVVETLLVGVLFFVLRSSTVRRWYTMDG
jgi:hypothetical protein